MDRIDSYIQQAFAKFQDVPEIQAQKEEMADHLRDRIADAIGQGKSEKDAFASATAAMSDAMPDLEQTLAEFLRPEFKHGVKQQPKPNTKEIYINFYRYHRAMMLMFVMAVFTLMMILLSDSFVRQMRWKWIDNLMGVTAYFNVFVGIFVVFTIVAYILKPRHVKRVSVSARTLLIKYGIGVFLITTITLVQWYATIFPDDSDQAFTMLLCFLLFYSAFFLIFCCLGWYRQSRYMKAPDVTQDTSLAKWGLLLSAVFLTVNLFVILAYMNMIGLNIRQDYEHGGPYNSVVMYNNQLQQDVKEAREQLRVSRDELHALQEDQFYKPRNGDIVGEQADNLPMTFFSPMASIHPPVVYLDRQNNSSVLKDGMAAGVYDSRRHATNQQLWTVHGLKGDFKIIDTGIRFLPDMPGGSSSMGMSSGMMMGPGMGMMGGDMMGSSMGGMMSGGMGSFDPPERKEHTLTLDGEFPASDLAENVICARQFPFEEYKLGMIQAVVPETVADGETFPLRLGVGNLDASNAKLLLTVEYDDGLQQNDIPSGATLFLGFIGSHEYREYKTEFTLHADSTPTDGKHTIRLTLRNESGLVIAETKVTVTCESS